MAYINRDPFARQELHRSVEPVFGGKGCAWCDNVRPGGKLYRYRVETDGGRKTEDDKLFCSISCRRAFYGE